MKYKARDKRKFLGEMARMCENCRWDNVPGIEYKGYDSRRQSFSMEIYGDKVEFNQKEGVVEINADERKRQVIKGLLEGYVHNEEKLEVVA